MPNIHPTAIVHPSAQLAEGVEIGAYAIVEADVTIGPGTVVRDHAVVRQYTTLGSKNFVDSFVTLGGAPQDFKFDPRSKTYVRIGNDNVFREGVTINRATGEGNATVVGNHTYWMTCAHAGHNATVHDDAILVNGAAVGGHAVLGARAILSSHVSIHQFCWVGEGVMTRGNSGCSMHVPPYSMLARINHCVGLNLVGLARNPKLDDEDRKQIKEAFRILYRMKLPNKKALTLMEEHTEWKAPAAAYRDFVRAAMTAPKPFDRGLARNRAE